MGDEAKSHTHRVIHTREDMRQALEEIRENLKERGYTSEDISIVSVGYEEMVLNALIHGNKNDPRKFVTLYIAISELGVEIEIEDQGDGFDPNNVEDPTDYNRLLKLIEEDNTEAYTHGRGIWMTREYMDSVIYNKKGNKVKIRKARNLSKKQEKENALKEKTTGTHNVIQWTASITKEELTAYVDASIIEIDFDGINLISSSEMSKLLFLMREKNKSGGKIRLHIESDLLRSSFAEQNLLNFDFIELS